jgi:large subunit ribosomal protein L3
MPRIRNPRRGSLQFWPRKRAKDIVARVRSWPKHNDVKLLGFAGYKAGMTHILVNDTRKGSHTKGMDLQTPVTILECPPLKIIGILLYTKDTYGLKCSGQITAEKLDKELSRKFPLPKKKGKEASTEGLAEVRVLAATQPKLTGIGKKKPEVFEIGIGGTKAEEKLEYAKGLLGNEITVNDVFGEGEFVDSNSITKGKGFQGSTKRFGLMLRAHKSEKTKRGPGSLGPWHGPKMWRTPYAGQMGFHQRIEYNKKILKVGDNAEEINAKGGFLRYGELKNNYLLVKGSLGGSVKRLITLTKPRRVATKDKELLPITHVSTSSQQ